MKSVLKLMCSLALAVAIAWIAPGAAKAENAVEDDSQIKGLWLTVPAFEKQSDFIDIEFDDPSGPASYMRSLITGSLFLTVERMEPIEYGEEAVKAAILEWNGEEGRVADLKVWADEDLSAKYSYPVFRADYTSGANEDTNQCHELIMYTDPFTFRVTFQVDADYAGGYTDDEYDPKWIDEWFSGIEFRE